MGESVFVYPRITCNRLSTLNKEDVFLLCEMFEPQNPLRQSKPSLSTLQHQVQIVSTDHVELSSRIKCSFTVTVQRDKGRHSPSQTQPRVLSRGLDVTDHNTT
jgi:hypothetical protein